ncbi:MAG: cytochrome c biogenesis protein CcsA [Syntrophales bacterium]|jgi:cytochrome c-type biogenesis protein CcsB|nr:cytochrome c biogenesis protein CcsA [Syntrophales bacterium]MCK9527295.1 cytochrome c biogenesis protein CcsA [Syntrophales bacterium]MDX9921235.1 cytochrome c biogenesis protein CcsA [Syntrophales bacterium]
MDALFFRAALVIYLAGTAGFTASLLLKRVALARLSTWVFAAAFALHTVFIGLRWWGSGYSPAVNLSEALSFIGWAIAAVYFLFQALTKTRVLGAFVAPLSLVMVIASSAGIMGPSPAGQDLKTCWVTVHVIFSLTGSALFALACCAALMYLIQDGLIRRRKIHELYRVLPSLGDLDRINHLSVLWGFLLLTLGIIAGSVWARTAWGSHLPWDPKQIATLAAWFLCGVLLHQRLVIGWKGRRAAFLSMGAFAILLFAFVGVNLFFTTIHTF